MGAKKRSRAGFTVWIHRDIIKARIHCDGMGGFLPLERDFGALKQHLGQSYVNWDAAGGN